MTRTYRNAALELADRGWHVFPLRPGRKEPLGRLVRTGHKEATADLAQALRWWTAEPEANVGVSCHPSGLVVVDVDPRNGGDDTLHDLERELGQLPETVRAETGGGGEHLIFRHPGEQLVGVLGPGVDLKDHGYIVAPPSLHPSGRVYAWDLSPEDVLLSELPEPWLERARARQEHVGGTVDLDELGAADPLKRIPAAVYISRLTGREVNRRGAVCCPVHGDGKEKDPSLRCYGTRWACYGCPPPPGRRARGGDIYAFAALLAGWEPPVRGDHFRLLRERLAARLLP